MDLKGLPQTVQNFIEETIQNRENGKFPDNETCQKVMEYAADTGSQKLAGLGLYYLAEYYRYYRPNPPHSIYKTSFLTYQSFPDGLP